jgi:hypothetical protein
VAVGGTSLNETTALGQSIQQSSATQASKELDFPSVDTILSTFKNPTPSISARGRLDLRPEEQDQMFRALQEVLLKSEEDEGSFDVQGLRASLEHADAVAQRGQRSLRALEGVSATLEKLWQSRSHYMAKAAEALANGSREREIYAYQTLH